MAKVLISFLGTGPDNKDKGRAERKYRPATYRIEESKDYPETSFVAEAIALHYKVDRIILIGTTKSMWERVYETFCERNSIPIDEEYWMELMSFCDNATYKTPIENFPNPNRIEEVLGTGSKIIPLFYGLNQYEQEENAARILGVEQYLKKGDEIIVDITHGFRSLPLYMMNLLIYLQNVSQKNIVISHVLYGMLDISRELGYTPIVELNGVLQQNEWITGAYSFKEFGNAYKIASLLDREQGIGKTVANRLRNFSDSMNINYIDRVKSQVGNLASMKAFEFSAIPNLIVPNTIKLYTDILKADSDSYFQFNLSKWHFEHKNYASSYMVLLEAILTYVCEKCQIDFGSSLKDSEFAKVILGKPDRAKEFDSDEVIRCRAILKPDYGDLKNAYVSINEIRNAIAHQTSKQGKQRIHKSADELIKTLETNINLLAKVLNSEKLLKKSKGKSKFAYFINLSNHPSDKWSAEQTAAANAQFGEIVNLPFPQIEPNATKEDILRIAQDYLNRVHQKGAPDTTAIHIMGEMTLTYQLVALLKDAGYRCYASTTVREVYEQEPGKKTVIFQFVNFREY